MRVNYLPPEKSDGFIEQYGGMMFAYCQFLKKILYVLFTVGIAVVVLPTSVLSASHPMMVQIPDCVPSESIKKAKWVGVLPDSINISLVFALPLRNLSELDDLLNHLYDPNDPQYGHYLTPKAFTDKFGPTQADYDTVADYATSLGLVITGTHPNRTLLDVTGPVETVNAAFGIQLQKYRTHGGREFYAPDVNPRVPDSIASCIVGIYGLDNETVWQRQSLSRLEATGQNGTGPGGGLTPNDIKKAYNLSGLNADGSGQILGLFELDGYNPADVSYYVNYFQLRSVPLENVLIGGASGAAGSGAAEVTIDIEMQIALAPGISKIIIYEGPYPSIVGALDTYNRIATDNIAKQISTSWGIVERRFNLNLIHSENAVFQQMAAQGQSFFAASGDSGAYALSILPKVFDPASQPYVVGVGGTALFLNTDGSYAYETVWNGNSTRRGGAGGGGVSSVWPVPAWQKGVAGAASASMRNVPDVSLNAAPSTGYAIYFNGNWYVDGGTSYASPLWAAFTACVNQVRTAKGAPILGFANPALYRIASGSNYRTDFHDIINGNNLYYTAGTGYDNATGWGSFNGAELFYDLVN